MARPLRKVPNKVMASPIVFFFLLTKAGPGQAPVDTAPNDAGSSSFRVAFDSENLS